MGTGKYTEWRTEDGLTKLRGWARDGLTDEQIAGNIGICRDTFYAWKKKYSDISDALKKGKEIVDIEVENALLKRAMGYKYTEVTRERVPEYENGIEVGSHLEVTKTVTKEVAPDTTAQIFWLKNRRPDKWRDRKDVGIDGSLKMDTPYDDLTVEELRALAKRCEADGETT